MYPVSEGVARGYEKGGISAPAYWLLDGVDVSVGTNMDNLTLLEQNQRGILDADDCFRVALKW